jgi:CheY-like chemotaxis protein
MVADIGLPGIDGVELLLRARQLPGLSDLQAIAATAWGQPEDAERIRLAGFGDHFVKPFDVQELVDRINERFAERQGSACPGAAPLQG